GDWAGDVAGSDVIAERVRLRFGIFSQPTGGASTDLVQCSASIETQPLLSMNSFISSCCGIDELLTGTWTIIRRFCGPVTIIPAVCFPSGTIPQSILTQKRSSDSMSPCVLLTFSHGFSDSME